MDPYINDDDQVRALKQWWERNGSSTLIGVGLALALVFGWQWWQQRQQSGVEQAAATYQQLLQAIDKSIDDPIQRTTAEHLATQLEEEAAGTRYADYGTLMRARLKVEGKDLPAAEAALRALLERHPDAPRSLMQGWVDRVLGRAVDPQLGALARLRLARVLFAMSRPDDALAVLDGAAADAFPVETRELRGDILRARNDLAGARDAYRAALALSGATENAVAPRLLQLKLQEMELSAPALAASPPQAAAAQTPSPVGATTTDTGSTEQ